MSSPTQRSLKRLRDDGWDCEVVERFNHHVMVRHDLFGFMDVLAYKPGEKCLAVQTTSGSNVKNRMWKIMALDKARRWMEAGHRIQAHGWRELVAYKQDGTKAKRKQWVPRIAELHYNNGVWSCTYFKMHEKEEQYDEEFDNKEIEERAAQAARDSWDAKQRSRSEGGNKVPGRFGRGRRSQASQERG